MSQKKFTPSFHEYNSLRQELITRITLINNQAHTAILTILTIWSAGFVLLAKAPDMVKNEFYFSPNLIIFLINFIFLIPIFYFIPLSVKSGENITQIASISAYIKVFYEYKSLRDKEPLFNWETTNNTASSINVYRGKTSRGMLFFNEEYTILSLSSLVIYIIVLLSLIFGHFWEMKLASKIAYSFFSILFLILGALGCYFIHKSSNMKKTMMDNTVLYLNKYLERAVNIGFITEAEYYNAKQQLDVKNNI